MSRSASQDAASERTPLIQPDNVEEQPPKRTKRLPSIIALATLCVAVVIALGVGFAAPAIVEEYAKDAAVFEPESLSIDSFTNTGIKARIKGSVYLDASKVKSKPVRDLGRAATWIARAVRTGDGKVNVYLPAYNDTLLGSATIPPIVLNIRHAHINYIDLTVDVIPGNITGIGRIAQDIINENLKELDVNAVAMIPVSSGLINLGTKTVAQSLHFVMGDRKMPKVKIENLKVVEYGTPGQPTGVMAMAEISAMNPYPVSFDIPPVTVEMLLPGCSDEFLVLGTASTQVVHVLSKQLVTANVTGLAKKLPESLTTICPGSNKSPLDTFVGAYLEGGKPKMYVRGGQQDPSKTPRWLGDLLYDTIVSVPVPAREFDNLIKSFSLSDVHLRLPEGDSDSKPRMSATVNVVVALPKDVNLNVDVERIRSDADVLYKGQKLGELDLHEWQKANSSKHGEDLWIQSEIKDAPLSVTDNKVFAEVVRQMLFGKDGITLGVRAKVDVESATALGQFVIRGVPAEGEVSMKPFANGGFKQKIKKIKVVDSTEDTLILETHVRAFNPTDYAAYMPFVNVSMWCNGTRLGDAWGSFNVVPGSNNLKAYASYRKSAVAKEFLSQYLSGNNVTATVRTHEGSVPGLPTTGLDLNFTVPHVFGAFLNETTMHIFTSTATFILHSPISMHITNIAASAFFNGTDIGNILYDSPFEVIAGSMETPRLPVDWNNNGGFGLIKKALGGNLKVDARANVDVKIGDFEDTLWYEARGLGAKVRL